MYNTEDDRCLRTMRCEKMFSLWLWLKLQKCILMNALSTTLALFSPHSEQMEARATVLYSLIFSLGFFYGKMKHIQPDLLTVREVTGNLCNSGARGEI